MNHKFQTLSAHRSNTPQSVLYLPAGPTRTQSVLYRKPWFSEREKGNTCNASYLQDILMLVVIVINRLLRDDVSKGKTSTKEKTSLRDIWNTLKDPALIGKVIIGYIFLTISLPMNGQDSGSWL